MKRITFDDIIQKNKFEDSLEDEFIYNNDFVKEGLKAVSNELDKETQFIGRPGEYFSYCNDGYGILSEIIHIISGIPFAKYIEEKIFNPLKMDRTNCSYIRNTLEENCSTLYTFKNDKWTIDTNFKNNAFCLMGAGSIKSTIADLTKYLLFFLNEGKLNDNKIILEKYFIKEMIKPRNFFDYNIYYCYGLQISEIDNRRYITHSGSLPGVSSCIAFCPEEQLGIIILCNTMDVPFKLISKAFFNLIIGGNELIDSPKLPRIKWNKNILSDIQGEYISREDEEDNFSIIMKENCLYLISDGKEKEIAPVFENEAIVKGKLKDNFIFLIKNDDNKIIGIKYGTRILKKTIGCYI